MKKLGWELRGLFGYGILSQMVQNSDLKPSKCGPGFMLGTTTRVLLQMEGPS